MRALRRLVLLVAALAGLYGLYWLWLERSVAPRLEAWSAAREAEGYAVAYGPIETSGFPLALDIALAKPVLRTPDGWGFRGTHLRARINPLKPRHVALWLDGPFVVASAARGTLSGAAEVARAELVLGNSAPERLSVAVTGFVGESRQAGAARAHPVRAKQIVLRLWGRDEEPALSPDDRALALAGDGLVLPETIVPSLGAHIAKLALHGTLRGAARAWQAPGATEARLSAWARQGGQLELSQLSVTWGALDILASGKLGLDGAHRPEGTLGLRIGGHRKLIGQFVADGSLPAEQGAQLSLALDLAAIVSNDGQGRLSVPVVMRRGRLIVGPVDVGGLKPLF